MELGPELHLVGTNLSQKSLNFGLIYFAVYDKCYRLQSTHSMQAESMFLAHSCSYWTNRQLSQS